MIVVSGEALMDVFDLGATATGHTLDARIGGSPLNVAIGLARLGQATAFFGAVSRGFLGDRLVRAMRDEGVDTSPVQRVEGPTTLGLVGLTADGVPDYAFYAEAAADRQLLPAALAGVPPARAFHFGSYAMVVEPIASTLRALVEREHRRSVVAYDPNVRLRVQPDLACWRAAVDWMVPRTHLLKVSDEDLGLLYPGEAVAGIARRWLEGGVGLVVVTQGARGAQAWSRTAHATAEPVPVQVVDTVGAGDTFQAALLTSLAEGGRLEPQAVRSLSEADIAQALRFASRAAAITCSRRGADLPRRSELA
jgi:fructokinase